MPLSEAELRRYSRHLSLPEIGVAGQERLQAARVLVIGTGGLGSPAALYLAAGGIGNLGVLDFDRVDESNLQRQVLYDTASIGMPKADLTRMRLAALNPELNVQAYQTELCAANVQRIFEHYDVIVDGSDRIATRYLVNDACVIYRKTLVSAAIHRFEGQAMTYMPGRGPCYRCLFAEISEGVAPSCAEAGVLGALPGVLGAIQATEAIKVVLGVGAPLIGRLLTYDALEMRFQELRFARRVDCAVCGDHPSITAPQDPPGFCTVDELRRVRSISAAQLAQRIHATGQPISLIACASPRNSPPRTCRAPSTSRSARSSSTSGSCRTRAR
ncbi:MAG: HesA/MoeB/ThiF family protein [Steroidobacterales bacterium]